MLLLAIISISSQAQKNKSKEYLYLFDSEWKPCKEDAATYMAYVQKINDTAWRWSYYNFWGSLLTVETFKDEKATVANGYFGYFDKNGKIDSGGYVVNGLLNGTWYLYGDSIKPQVIHEYEMGRLVNSRPVKQQSDNEKFSGKEAEYKGGTKSWIHYLENNLNFPARAQGKGISGMVAIAFVVDEAGQILEPFFVRSVEFSLDQEAMRLIRNSKTWSPAELNGEKVKAYRIQPITFAY